MGSYYITRRHNEASIRNAKQLPLTAEESFVEGVARDVLAKGVTPAGFRRAGWQHAPGSTGYGDFYPVYTFEASAGRRLRISVNADRVTLWVQHGGPPQYAPGFYQAMSGPVFDLGQTVDRAVGARAAFERKHGPGRTL